MIRICTAKTGSGTGFTLAEMLVTLVVFSLVMVVVTDGLQTGAAVWTKVESRMGQAEQVAMSEQLLAGIFDRAYPVNTVSGFSGIVPTTSTAESFSFIYYSPPWPDEAGYVLVELQIADSETGKKLDLIRHRMISGKGDLRQFSTRTGQLIDGVDHLEFSYLDRDRRSGLPIWKSGWSDPDVLPKVARLTVGLADKSVEITFQLPNAMAPECVGGKAGFRCEVRR